ncbi:MAG TPA: sensor histidine kinase [Verrucomicrobiae bacterium]|jgi:signal transduction histidine kinase|nr:sensor histidine kinase [Verrucomicrobiae bacterium]
MNTHRLMNWKKFFSLITAVFCTFFSRAAETPPTNSAAGAIEMDSVIVDNENRLPSIRNHSVSLGSSPQNVMFYFRVNTNYGFVPLRIHYQLQGYDGDWRKDPGEMNLTVRFFNDAGDQVNEKKFTVSGQSAGWNGSLKTSPLTHRRESVVVPAQASRLMIVVSSAGPPATAGIYVVGNLVVTRSMSNAPAEMLMQFPTEHQLYDGETNLVPQGWVRDGTARSMAKIVRLEQESDSEALAIIDDSLISHAEWHNTLAVAPKVVPGEHLIIEWNEMFSIGVGDPRVGIYKNLPRGNFHFHVEALDVMGMPTGIGTSIDVVVPPPFWRTFWFWNIVLVTFVAMIMIIGRYIIVRRMRQGLLLLELRLEKQRLLEQERLRIAHDIHDDLGARVTQISLVSAMARSLPIDPDQAQVDFDKISEMSRDLVTALYETVWSVNPENDNLNELGNYLFQMVNKFCERAQCRCRFYVDLLPREMPVPSQIRHNICMAVKEAVNNAIKHADASEITVRITYAKFMLTILIQDDGCGFDTEDVVTGNGLPNLKQRLKDINGVCTIESQPGHGTKIQIRLEVGPVRLNIE